MSDLVRLSFSIEKGLYDRLEHLVKEGRYTNRSEYIRDLIRDRLVEREWEKDQEALGTVTLVYDHHTRGLHEKLTELQHEYHNAGRIREVADLLRQQKGVFHASLSMSSTGRKLA